jgi:proton-translocating NADH-quinone oxidoreductase chain L
MKGDPYLSRFLAFLSLFTFFMLFLVSSGNLIQLFIGWEGVGLCSFLLISFWTERLAANKAAIKAMVINKIGDCFYLIGVALFLQHYGTTSFSVFLSDFFFLLYPSLYLNYSFFGISFDFVTIVGLFFFLAVMSKSAQFGFHTWLPDAMEGPTPVSALIHAATMVTAGVFLLLRLGSFFQFSLFLQYFVVLIGLLTMFFAASVALFQMDIKKVIAYSTCSQLGYMVVACGLSFYGAAFFHLLTHAFFKALLFLGAGAVIHFFNDEQDVRRMGGAFFYMRFTFISMLIATLALLGFPFTSGYFSKDRLLELFFLTPLSASYFIFFIGFFVSCLTSFYSFRLLYLVFLNKPSGFSFNYFYPFFLDKKLIFVFSCLLFFTLVFGFFYVTFFP